LGVFLRNFCFGRLYNVVLAARCLATKDDAGSCSMSVAYESVFVAQSVNMHVLMVG